MTLLEILEKGLSVLENSVNQHRDVLTAQLAIGEKISDKDTTGGGVSHSAPSFVKTPIAVSATFVENGLQAFNKDQGCVHEKYPYPLLMDDSTSIPAPPATRNLRIDGGSPSSPAFAAE
ncbi:hypothetical protein B0H14DRAFT_2603330 [Mycena olivaceomarginata]|nr:hypothetical protein B0H14DRAFT_2603330 [Mycena olivaceomarginata]